MQNLSPPAAYALLRDQPKAILIDCRSEMEHLYVGHPVGAVLIPWAEAPGWEIDPNFVGLVRQHLKGDLTRPVVLICRSGHRSLQAALVLEAAGFAQVANVLEGFEGPLDANLHRGTTGGWRFHGLPWQQA